jgi:O-antigen/teichoic acid export membrane protein
MSLLKKLAGETAIYGLSSIAGRVLNYLLVPLYTRLFTQSEYGIVSELYALTGFLAVLFIYRMETAYFRFGTEAEKKDSAYTTALGSVVMTTLLLSGAVVLFAQPITQWLDYGPGQETYVILFGLILGLDAVAEIPLARLRLQHRARRFALVRLFGIAVNIGCNLFFLLLCPWLAQQQGQQWVEAIWQPGFGIGYIFLSNLIASLAVLLLLLPEIWRNAWTFDGGLWRSMIVYSAPLVLASLAGIVNETIDRELLKQFLPGNTAENLAQIGIYSAAYKLSMLLSLFTQAFRYAAEPFFFSQAKHQDAKVMYATVTRYFTIAAAFAFLLVTLYLDVFQHFLGSDFRSGLEVVPILLMANLFLGLYYNLSIWYKLTDQTHFGAWIALGGAAVTIGLNSWWIPELGYLGSAWATLCCYALMTAACWFWGKRYYPVPYDLKGMGGYVLLALSLYALSSAWPQLGIHGQLLTLSLNSLLLLAFAAVAWKVERKALARR